MQLIEGYTVEQFIEAMHYKPESRRLDSRMDPFHWILPLALYVHLRSTQPLTEIVPWISPMGKATGA
jgi:hypothetical protein